ncbi:MAG: hypothetical protein M4579_001065 [Chaenotheca gracillima]|nr:MAG: hypothetical protein M4579_001065 [Chaenotheca gracillima]
MLSCDERPQLYGGISSQRRSASGSKVSNGSLGVPCHRHIWIITGPAGCGKSTVAQFLAESLHLPFVEGDEFHPQSNIEKMREGIALTDADRWDWLVLLRQKAVERLMGAASTGVVLTCSALKRKYRDVIRIAAYNDHDLIVHFIYLRADEEVLMQRVKARKGHFMKHAMVQSQFRSLEEPESDEKDSLSVDVTSNTMPQVQRETLRLVQDVLAHDNL